MPIPGGAAALLRQCGMPATLEPARALLVLARAVHAPTPASTHSTLSPVFVVSVLDTARRTGLPADSVPALLPLGVWQRDVFRAPITSENLAAAIIADRRASLLYYGLFSLDEETLAFFVSHPSLISSIYRYTAAAFAEFAESITVRDGRVVLPGDEDAGVIWQDLVGTPANDPVRFIPWLLSKEDGRLAWMFDTIAHLDAAHQAFALGRAAAGPAARRQYVNAVYGVFAKFQRDAFPFPVHPFVHPPVDPALVLAVVAVTPDGRLAPPADRATFAASFAVGNPNVSGEVDAPWLLEHVFTLAGRTRLDTLLFAQRLFAAAALRSVSIDAVALSPVLSAFPAHAGLLLGVERLGFVEPRDYQAALDAAAAVPAGGVQAALRAAMFQGALALLVRLREVGTIDDARAQALARTLMAWPTGDRPSYSDALLDWFDMQLLAALSGGRAVARGDAEALLLDGLSGALARRPTPIVQWEDHSYRVDPAAGERARLRNMLDRQHACSLDMARDLRHLVLLPADAANAPKIAEIVSAFDLAGGGTVFGFLVPPRRDDLLADLRNLQRDPGDASRWQRVRERAFELLDVLTADILAAHAYAIAVEEPESPLLLVDHAARSHDFDVRDVKQVGAWRMPANIRMQGASVVTGSLLGLERAVAVFSLRRSTLDSPAVAPALGQQDVQGLAESAAALNAFRLTDTGRDVIAAALARGRARIAATAGDSNALDALVATAAVEGWRRRLIRWTVTVEGGAPLRYLSLNEVFALGLAGGTPPDVGNWGVSQRFLDGSFGVGIWTGLAGHQMRGRRGAGLLSAYVADLPLRVAESFAALKLPSALAHGVVQYATWDLVGTVQMADLDDWLAVICAIQRLTPDQIADYVSALTADGPLVPAK